MVINSESDAGYKDNVFAERSVEKVRERQVKLSCPIDAEDLRYKREKVTSSLPLSSY